MNAMTCKEKNRGSRKKVEGDGKSERRVRRDEEERGDRKGKGDVRRLTKGVMVNRRKSMQLISERVGKENVREKN